MRKFRMMLGMLAVLAGVFAAAYWIHPVDLQMKFLFRIRERHCYGAW